MKSCCKTALGNIQGVGELGGALQMFLAASPFILILPDILPPNSAREATETLVEKVGVMAGETVLKNVTNGSQLPDFADSVRAVHEITINRMHQFAQIHSLRHPKFSLDGQTWAILTNCYDPAGEIRSGGGWDWNPFW